PQPTPHPAHPINDTTDQEDTPPQTTHDQALLVGHEDTNHRRVNVLGAQVVDTAPDLLWQRTCEKVDAAVLLEFVCTRIAGLPGGVGALELAADGLGTEAIPVWERAQPCTVVLDNASVHTARAFKGRRKQLSKIGVELFYLPPRSPELNDIELVWRHAKYQDYPQRAQTSIEEIGQAIDRAMLRQCDRIRETALNRARNI
ncbi:transposase, partial [Streptomyces varsoviensis]|uniref:transposase n=1 Tax=Streptomyces varsoviensis TaxID=67373 RepID=UPI0034052ECC